MILECLNLPSNQQNGHISSYHYVRPPCMCACVRVYVCVCVLSPLISYHNVFAYACVCTSVKCVQCCH